jgi:UDP-glucose 4-epimerase
MNILLTGGTGYIGSHTAVDFLQAGHQVTLLDNLSNSDSSVVSGIERIAGQTIPFVECDVRDTALLSATLRDHGIEAVIHFAGLKAVGESVQKPVLYYDNNLGGTISLIKAMHSSGLKKLIFSSSAVVYGNPQYLPYDELHPTVPTNPYGQTKLQIEQFLLDVCASDPDWGIICLRYFNPVGAHHSGLIGENPSGIPNNLMPYVARVASGNLPELNIFGNDYDSKDGTGERDYIHVMDLARGHAAALNFLKDNSGWQAINLGTGRSYSVLDMIYAFEKVSKKLIPRKYVARRPGDLARYFAETSKAQLLLGWTATQSLDDMCESTWTYQQGIKL